MVLCYAATEGAHGHENGPSPLREHEPEHAHAALATLFGHSHSAADQTDTALESSARGIRVLALSLAGLGATAAVQLVIALASGSVGLLADTIHNGADALTALPLFLAFRLGARAPNRRYTYGYGRSEDLAGVFIVAMIAISTIVAGWESLRRLLDPQPVNHIGWVMLGAVVGFAGNETVAFFRIREGKRIGSAALEADGYHVDCEIDLRAAHRIAEEARHAVIHGVPKLAEVIVHPDPCRHRGEDHHAPTGHQRAT